MPQTFGRRLYSIFKALLARLRRVFRIKMLRRFGAASTLTFRVTVLLAPPLTCAGVLYAFFQSSQGRESSALFWTKGWLAPWLLAITAGLLMATVSTIILGAYSARMNERLASFSDNPGKINKFIYSWVPLAIGTVGLLLALNVLVKYALFMFIALAAAGVGMRFVPRVAPHLSNVHRLSRWPLVIILAVVILMGTAVAILDVPNVRAWIYSHGPLPIIFAGLIYWMSFVGLFLVALPVRFRLPSLLLMPLLLAAFWSGRSDYNEISLPWNEVSTKMTECDRLTVGMSPSQTISARRQLSECNFQQPLKMYYREWLRALPVQESADYIPLFLVSAEGGGVRAAYWTAALLDKLDRETRGRFSKHVFAISGVSGGTVGMMAYFDQLRHRGTTSVVREGAVQRTFRHDLLSPLVYGLLFPDAMRNVLGKNRIGAPTRAELFEKELMDVWLRESGSDAFSMNFVTAFAPDARKGLPVLIANSTVAESGDRFLISNVALDPADFPSSYVAFDPAAPYSLRHLSSAQVAHLSARFPFVSPAASVRAAPSLAAQNQDGRRWSGFERQFPLWGHLVDGGYFENSGATTLLDVFRLLQNTADDSFARLGGSMTSPTQGETEFLARAMKVRVYVLSIRNDPHDFSAVAATHPREPLLELALYDAYEDALHRWVGQSTSERKETYSYFDYFSELLTPPKAMLATREARGAASRTALRWAVNGTSDVRRQCNPLEEQGVQDLGQSILCEAYAGRWIEVNLAAAFSEEMNGSIDQHFKCAGFDSVRPPLGWTISVASAELMDCFLREDKFFGGVMQRVGVILESQQRSTMLPNTYHLIEGWQQDHRCDVSRGQWIVKGRPAASKPAIDHCMSKPSE